MNIKRLIMRVLSYGREQIFWLFYEKKLAQHIPLLESIYSSLYRFLLENNFYGEPGTAALVKNILKEGMTFIDIGANVGTYSYLASKIVGDNGRVFAFEPHPGCFSTLKKITKNKKNITAFQKAVSDQDGFIEFHLSAKNSGTHSIYNSEGNSKIINVETVKLDNIFKNVNKKIDLILMDVEGAEPNVINGMKDLLVYNNCMQIITEFNPQCLERANYSPTMFLDDLIAYGFALYIIDESDNSLKKATQFEVMSYLADNNKKYINLLCKKT